MAVQTVLGKIDGSKLGRTLTHEHMLLDYRKFFVPSPPDLDKFLGGEITLKNIGFVQRYPYSSKSNISFYSEDTKKAVLYDVEVFKSFGGGTIIENTNHGLKRDIRFLREVSERTGVHVVAGTGYYLAPAQSESDLNKSVEEMHNLMKGELINGCLDDPGIKCGFMGEIASNYPIHSFEKRAIQATGAVQQELGCPVSFHPGRDVRAPAEILRIYTEAGGDSRKAAVSHLERTLKDLNQFLDLASEYKCYLQLDLFGTEVLTYQFHPEFQMPSDAQRIHTIKKLIENGLGSRVLVSHDIHTKHRLGNSAKDAPHEAHTIYESGSANTSTVHNRLRNPELAISIQKIRIAEAPSSTMNTDLIEAVFAESPRHNVRELVDAVDIPKTTIEYGGHGYCHLLKNVFPKMLSEGISQEVVDRITIHNPRNWLTW